MKRLCRALAVSAALLSAPALAAPGAAATAKHKAGKAFQFGLLPYPAQSESAASWQAQIAASSSKNLAFVVANGFKTKLEPCSDDLYLQRKAVLDDSGHALMLSLSAYDWSECEHSDGSSAAQNRLNRVRELFYSDEMSLGNSRLEVVRMALNPKFRNYRENARWQVEDIIFATINVPANNNHYLRAAGRNHEFEDRQVANLDWLQTLFVRARNRQASALVLFADGNWLHNAWSKDGKLRTQFSTHDGYAGLQQRLFKLTEKFHGKVLLISHDAQDKNPQQIQWHGKIGVLNLAAQDVARLRTVQVRPGKPNLFSLN